MIDTRLRDFTVKHLKNRSRSLTLKKISDDTDIPETWLAKFVQAKTDNPSVNYCLTLYQYLTNTTIPLA